MVSSAGFSQHRERFGPNGAVATSPGLSATGGLPWVNGDEHQQPQRGRGSIPNVPLVELDIVFAKQCSKFILEGLLAMMYFLICNIFGNLRQIGLAY